VKFTCEQRKDNHIISFCIIFDASITAAAEVLSYNEAHGGGGEKIGKGKLQGRPPD
jgi:hypothetical protein